MIQKNTDLVDTKVRMAIANGGILISPFITLAVVVWVYTQRWAGITANMDLAVIGVNTASLSLAIYVSYFISVKVSEKLVEDLKKNGLLVVGARVVDDELPTEVKVAGGILNGVQTMTSLTSLTWVRKPVKRQMLAIEAPKPKVESISLEKADA